MTTSNIIEGLTILQKYYDNPDGYNVGADHDALYAFKTDLPVEPADLERLVQLGWIQEEIYDLYKNDIETAGRFGVKHYDPHKNWVAYL